MITNVKNYEKCIIPHPNLVNLYGCDLDENVFIGPFVEIQKNSKVGKNSRISSHTFVCEGVDIGEDCFIAHGVMFTNDVFTDSNSIENWKLKKTKIGNGVRIGSNSTILPVAIGDNAICVTTHLPNELALKMDGA